MDKFVIIFCAIFAILIVAGVIVALLKTRRRNGAFNFVNGIKEFVRDEPSAPGKTRVNRKRIENPTEIFGAKKSFVKRDGWMVELLTKNDGQLLAEGFFNKEYFKLEPFEEREKHYKIGRSKESDLVVKETFREVGNNHGYVRYKCETDEFLYWDNSSKYGTYTDENSTVQIPGYIAISDGLKLYISSEVYLVFTRV